MQWAESNNEEVPDPFYIFLSGAGGVGKSHLINVIAEYCKRNLKAAGQNVNQPSIVLTASTGIAASKISGSTVHSAFNLPVMRKFRPEQKKNPTVSFEVQIFEHLCFG